ncbi:MAG: hypothetical protein Q8Q39_05610 [bacterium]|nr:hypothetical protein [bacterium]
MTAFILALWSATLSAAGFFGQLVIGLRGGAIQYAASELSVAGLERPKLMMLFAVGLFFLPTFVSCFLTLRHIKRTGRTEGLYIASLSLNTFSLLYGLVLYGALR